MKKIQQVAVLGGGVMGAGIAAQLASCGFDVCLVDIVPKEPGDPNRLAKAGIAGALKAKPAAFYDNRAAARIRAAHYDDEGACLAGADWIIEVVAEDLRIKGKVFDYVVEHAPAEAIVSSNTSGIPLAALCEGRDESFKNRFLITHFFNPVRYLRLVEVVAGDCSAEHLATIRQVLEDDLGKGVVVCKDSPNFVANRIGVFGMMTSIRRMSEHGLGFEEVDAIVGPPMGRPKSACFRTGDLVGIDTLAHVTRTVFDRCPDDEQREVFDPPKWLLEMIEKDLLGNKTRAGFYKKTRAADGSRAVMVYEPETGDYREKRKFRTDALGRAKNTDDLNERLRDLVGAEDDPAGQYAWQVFADTVIYAANRIPEIADSPADVDRAMRWGFNWDLGPFEAWEAVGLAESLPRLEADGYSVPDWVRAAAEAGGIYRESGLDLEVFDPATSAYVSAGEDPRLIDLARHKRAGRVLVSNDAASLIDIGDGVALLEFHTKMNALDSEIGELAHRAMAVCDEQDFKGIVIGNQGENFSVGANLMLVWMNAQAGNFDELEGMVKAFQDLTSALHQWHKPVVAAPHAMTLGGGCEICLGADRVVAAAETYMGLVEVGAGVIPAGGGCMEMIRRFVGSIPDGVELDRGPYVQALLKMIGMADVATGGFEAKRKGFLTDDDVVVINREQQLHVAKQHVLGMAQAGYAARPKKTFKLPGKDGYAQVQLGLMHFKMSGMISDHDQKVAEKLGWILCGGDCGSQEVSEDDLLDLERAAFVALSSEEKSLARMQSLLMTGKPLRN
jgi:3-hydroxyacyl-CoA dehydrogenase